MRKTEHPAPLAQLLRTKCALFAPNPEDEPCEDPSTERRNCHCWFSLSLAGSCVAFTDLATEYAGPWELGQPHTARIQPP